MAITFLRRINTAKELYVTQGFGLVIKFIRKKYFHLFSERQQINKIAKNTIRHNLSETEIQPMVEVLANGVAYVYGMAVDGDIAEFGTHTGRTAVVLASSVNYRNYQYRHDLRGNKTVWYFDSFQGLPEPRFAVDKKSHHVSTGIWKEGDCSSWLDEKAFAKLIKKYLDEKWFVIKKGWFKDSVREIPEGQSFSFLHIDGDLYESAIDVLDYLFKNSMISVGAIILFDDWNCNAADPNFGERRAWAEVLENYKIEYSDLGSYGVCSHRFIVHKYQ